MDDSKIKLKQITKAVSKHLGTGKIKSALKEDALLNKEITVILNLNVFDECSIEIKLMIYNSKLILT